MNNDERSNRSLERRRELNRQAAQKLRNRQKERAVVIKQEYFAAQSKNTQLSYEVKQLRRFKEELEQQVTGHLPVCHKTHYARSDSMSALSAATSQPVQYFQSFPSGQLVPLSFNNQVVSYDMTPSGVQVLTITPVGPGDTDGDDVADGSVADSNVASATDDAAVDGNAAENHGNGNSDNISDVSDAGEEQSEQNIENNTDTAANVEVTETIDQPVTKQEKIEIQKQNSSEDNVENAHADDDKKIVKSPRTSSRSTRAVPPRSHSPIERVTRHAARKHAPPVKRGGKASVAVSAPTPTAMDVDSNLPVTVSALSEDD